MKTNANFFVSELESRSLEIWREYEYFKGLDQVQRSGFSIYQVYDSASQMLPHFSRSESDLEHTAGCLVLLPLFAKNFPRLFEDLDLVSLMMTLLIHEIGELEIGDIPDDGKRDNQEKDRIEKSVMDEFTQHFPYQIGRDTRFTFYEMQHHLTRAGRIAYCIDKFEAILQGLRYEKQGRPGTITQKIRTGEASKRDLQGVQKANGSLMLVDIWGANAVALHSDILEVAPFMSVLESAYLDVRGYEPAWLDFKPSKEQVFYLRRL